MRPPRPSCCLVASRVRQVSNIARRLGRASYPLDGSRADLFVSTYLARRIWRMRRARFVSNPAGQQQPRRVRGAPTIRTTVFNCAAKNQGGPKSFRTCICSSVSVLDFPFSRWGASLIIHSLTVSCEASWPLAPVQWGDAFPFQRIPRCCAWRTAFMVQEGVSPARQCEGSGRVSRPRAGTRAGSRESSLCEANGRDDGYHGKENIFRRMMGLGVMYWGHGIRGTELG